MIRRVPSLAKVLDTDDETRGAMFLAGLMWEDLCVNLSGWGQGQQAELDGIICTPDIVIPLPPDGPRIDECKWSWKKEREDIRDDWRWMTQAKAYCKAFGTDWVRFHVFFCNGNYYPPSPVVREFDIRFTRQEVEDNWSMLRNHARWMKENPEG